MNRGVIVLVLVAVAWALAMPAGAAAPGGPRLAISVSTDGPGAEDEGSEVITTGPSGEDPQRLVGGPGVFIGDALSWSSDGNRLAFGVGGVESTASGPFGTGWQVVGVADVGGGPARVFPRAFLNTGAPVMAPDGRSVAFPRLKLAKSLPGGENNLYKASIWLLDVEDGSVKRLTRWRLTGFLDPISYSPDSTALIAILYGHRGLRLVLIDLGSLRSRPLAQLGGHALGPTYSPDGTKLAWVRWRQKSFLPPRGRPVSELVVGRADGTGAKRLLRRRGSFSFLSWDPSGSRLAFTHNPPPEATGSLSPVPGNRAMAINADGTCLTRVFTDPELTLHGSAWQPGIGREAGPIDC